jgi:hypothetical protein
MSLDLAAVKAALKEWIVATSGLPDEQVIWDHKKVDRGLPEPYIILDIKSLRQVGQPRVQQFTRPTPGQYDDPILPGEEIEIRTETSHELLILVQGWAEDPISLLQPVRRNCALPSIRRGLRNAGIGVGELRTITEIGGVQDPRAVMDVKLFLTDTVSEFIGYIETVEITDHIAVPEETFRVSMGV